MSASLGRSMEPFPLPPSLIGHASRIASLSADTALSYTGCDSCLFSIYLENREIASASSGMDAQFREELERAYSAAGHSAAEEWQNNGKLVRRFFRQVSRRMSYALFLCRGSENVCNSINLEGLTQILDHAVLLLDEVEKQSASMDIIARSVEVETVRDFSSIESMLTEGGNAVSRALGCRGFAAFVIRPENVSIAGGYGNTLDIGRTLMSDVQFLQEIRSLVDGGQPKKFPGDDFVRFPAISSKFQEVSANAVRLAGGFSAVFFTDLRGSHALALHNIESCIQISLQLSLAPGIAFMERNLRRFSVRSLRSAFQSLNEAADLQTLEALFTSEMQRLLGKTKRFCTLQISGTPGGALLRSCACHGHVDVSVVQTPPDDVILDKVVRERLPVISHTSAEPSGGDSPNNENMAWYIPYAVDNESLRVLFVEKELPSVPDTDIESSLLSLSGAFVAKSEELQLKHRLSGWRKRFTELNNLLSSFSHSGLKIDGTVRGASMLRQSFSGFSVVAYFERQTRMECISFSGGGTVVKDVPEIDASPIERLMHYSDAVTFEMAEAESDSLKRDVVSSFSRFMRGDEQTCMMLCVRRGPEPFSFLVVFSSEPITEAVETCGLLKSIVSNMSTLSSFRERLSIEREIGFANRNMLNEIGRVDPEADIHALSADFCRLLSSFSGSETCIVYNRSHGENFEFTAAYPDGESEPPDIIKPDDSGLEGIILSGPSVIRHFNDRGAVYSTLLKASKKSYVAWDVMLIHDDTGEDKPGSLVFLGYSSEISGHEAERSALLQLSRAFTRLMQIKLMSFSPETGPSMDAGFLNLIFSSVRFENGRWEFDDAEVASRFSLMMGKALGMKYSMLYSVSENNTVAIEGGNPSFLALDKHAVGECIDIISDLVSDAAEDSGPYAADKIVVDRDRHPALSSLKVGKALIVPLRASQGTGRFGFFLIDEKKPRGYFYLRMAETIADAYVTVRENRINRMRMEWTLNALSSELRVVRNISSTFELPAIMNYATQEVNAFVGADITCLFLEDDASAMNIASVAGSPKELIEEVMRRPAAETHYGEARRNGFSSLVADSASHFHMPDLSSSAEALSRMPAGQRYDVELLNRGMQVKCVAGAPVSFAGKMLGILVCFNTTSENAFREMDIGFIESVAALLATAIENSRNFRTTYDALNKLGKLDTLRSNFSSIAAHELRTPLTSIRVYIELMKAGRVGKFTESEKKNIGNLLASITELNEIISNMLEFTRMEALLLETEMSPTFLVPVVEEVCAMVSPQLNAKEIELELSLDRNTIKINANAPLIKRVANNLLGNAIKFTPSGGRISVSMRNESDGVLLTVTDTGRGIPEEDIPLIFDRYHVVDASILHSGTGFRFGLPITKLIVERHGGKIWAESILGKGSKFFVFLPSQKSIFKEEWLSEATAYIH